MEKKIKVIALDVYGTILPTKGENVKRKGLDAFLQKCKNQGLILCTCSDAEINDVMENFREAELNPRYFDEYFKMERKGKNFYKLPKNFSPILEHYNLFPEELLVIGDRIQRDINPAENLGCKTILVPEYFVKEDNNFDMNGIEIK